MPSNLYSFPFIESGFLVDLWQPCEIQLPEAGHSGAHSRLVRSIFLSWPWWCTLVIMATWETEAGRSLNLRYSRRKERHEGRRELVGKKRNIVAVWNSRDKNGGKIKYILCVYENVAVELLRVVTECYKKTRSCLPSSICFLFQCVWWVHVCIHVCMYMGTCVCRCPCTWRSKVDVGNRPPYLLHLIQWGSLNQTPSLSRWLVLIHSLPWISCFCLLSLEL